MSPENQLYSPDELRLQRLGARLLLMKLLAEAGNDWNGYGLRLWAEQRIAELDE